MSRLRKVRQPNGEIVPFRQQRISRSISEERMTPSVEQLRGALYQVGLSVSVLFGSVIDLWHRAIGEELNVMNIE